MFGQSIGIQAGKLEDLIVTLKGAAGQLAQ